MVVFVFNTVIYVFLLLCLCILIVCLCIFTVPAGTLRLPWLRVFHALSSVVRWMPGYKFQRRGTARTLPRFLCRSVYCLFCVVPCTVCFVSFRVLSVLCRSVYCLFCVVLCTVCFVSFCVLFVLCRSVYCLFCVVLCIVCFVSFCVLFACKCVLFYRHRVAIQL